MFLVSGIRHLFSWFIPGPKARADDPLYQKLKEIVPQISRRECGRIQATISANRGIYTNTFARKQRKSSFSVSITPQGVAYVHLGKKGRFLGEGSYKRVYEALRVDGNSVSKIAEARIKKPSEIPDALKEDELARKFISPHNIEASEAVVLYRGRRGLDKARFMQPLMAKDGWQFLQDHPTFEQRLKVVEGAVLGLRTIHKARYVHRDVKPSNILIDDKGTAKLADIGFAIPQKQFKEAPLKGTREFLPLKKSIEGKWHMEDERAATTDLYALGVTIDQIMGETATSNLSALQTRLKALNPQERPSLNEAIAIIENAHREMNAPPVQNLSKSICGPLINFP